MKITDATYKKWLKSAYQYYWGSGNTLMTDAEWDHIAKSIIADDWSELKGTGYEAGQSLFWLKEDKYPSWAKE